MAEPDIVVRPSNRLRAPGPGSQSPNARPLLKWAGGKRQLLPRLREHYPPRFTRYIEPFLGSGAVFFDLHHRSLLAGRGSWLLDDNADLVGCYRCVRDHTEAVIAELGELAREHRDHGTDFYYEIRDRRFNPARANAEPYTPALAAMLIYLNRTGFNGLFRLNRSGAFNVPAGRYVNPSICDPQHLRDVAAALGAAGVAIERGSFERSLNGAGPGDFVYCDPPYAPLTRTASFATYTAGGFGPANQACLQRALVEAAGRGAMVLLSNSSAQIIEDLYASRSARDAGLMVLRVPARRSINSRAALRGPVDELLITNIPRTGASPRLTVMPRMARARLAEPLRRRA